ncbi:MAG: deoxyribodipyrimidine photo-lyase [Burkholderiaceae bacterium]|nr:deoxyribodipyrimidine photo-lyase [Burkholderiaceae bacterium]
MPRWDSTLVWFRRDLRDFDHAALSQALAHSRQVYGAFVFDTDILEPLRRDRLTVDQRLAYIHAALLELDQALRTQGGGLIVLHARAVEAIPALAAKLNVDAVLANRDYEPQAKVRDAQVAAALAQAGRHWHAFKDQAIFDTDEILTQSGQPYSVFTPYKRAWLARLEADGSALAPHPVEPFASRLAPPPAALDVGIPALTTLGFMPIEPVLLGVPPGMSGGARLFDDFCAQRIGEYERARDFPALEATSRLSVHLRFGTVSIRTLAQRAYDAIRAGHGSGGAATWLAELIWRDFYFMILDCHPQVVSQAFKPAFDAVAWEEDEQADQLFDAWCAGQTGYPLVDAAMAQLNRTGFMHNRLRMVAASFLVKDLGIDWRRGEAYFAQRLDDFDLAANNGGWQWAASTGCDAQPYFRIFNPVTQSEKFDPDGVFIRRFLPQLARLDSKTIHAPWLAPAETLRRAGVELGGNYPRPVVQHEAARQRTLARYVAITRAAAAKVVPGR